MDTTLALSKINNVPATFTAFKFKDSRIDTSKQFIYGMTRSAKSTIAYIKGNMMSLLAIVIENSGEVITPEEAISLLKLDQNKTKSFNVNAFSFENSCYNAVAFLKF